MKEQFSLSVVILSYAVDDEVYRMNCRCISSLSESENWHDSDLEVLLIESNKSSAYEYDSRVRVIVPQENFNFHKFLNIGLDNSTKDFIAFCNNDIEFSESWFSAIMAAKSMNRSFLCFSPYDSAYPMMAELCCPPRHDYEIGWENKKHFAAWCFVWQRKVFDIIGKFDETFDFYSADDDELMTLRKYAIPNVLVTKSEVRHLSQVVTRKVGETKSYRVTDKQKYPLTAEELRKGMGWLWDDYRFYDAYQHMKNKWGNMQMIRRINRLLENFPILRKSSWLTRFLYNKHVNLFLSHITGIKF